MMLSENCIWKLETPGSVPMGARISAGNSGSVEMSLPIKADVSVNCEPVSCMPSPESPAKRTVTDEMDLVILADLAVAVFAMGASASLGRRAHLVDPRREVVDLVRIKGGQEPDQRPDGNHVHELFFFVDERNVIAVEAAHQPDRLADRVLQGEG